MEVRPDYQGWTAIEKRTQLSRYALLKRKKQGLKIQQGKDGVFMLESDWMAFLDKKKTKTATS
jgi:hypothetical protein